MKAFLAVMMLGVAFAVIAVAAAPSERTYRDPTTGHRYVYVPGNWTQAEAWGVARARGGYPVVFSSMGEHQRVVNALNFREIAPAHTGHYQTSTGREPHMGWRTYTGEASAHLHDLFNSSGPDDGVRNKWGWCACGDGVEVFYGPSSGKNEDAGVIWHDNQGRLEDISVNGRGGVVIEFNR